MCIIKPAFIVYYNLKSVLDKYQFEMKHVKISSNIKHKIYILKNYLAQR